ncbi:unnamed protein product [Adineta steineri]|uniref:Pentapeptide repeat-containing protein n=1 Tax=Adineta steineri TaxID=433720 RepID=A0A818JZM0_9BILA|nr:unnamed protein product [Adineta steineri]
MSHLILKYGQQLDDHKACMTASSMTFTALEQFIIPYRDLYLPHVDLTHASFINLQVEYANVTNVDFTNANLTDVNISDEQ